MSAQVQITWFTKETAEHRPVIALQLIDLFRVPIEEHENWHKVHDELMNDEEKRRERLTYYASIHWPPCGNCDWDYLQRNSEAAQERREIKRRVRQFERTGKFPPQWLAPRVIKFGGAALSAKEAARVVLPRIPRSLNAGEPGYAVADALLEGDTVLKYLAAVNGVKPVYRTEGSKRTRVYRCGCNVAEFKGRHWDSEWFRVSDGTVFCLRHRAAIFGRDEESGEVYGGE